MSVKTLDILAKSFNGEIYEFPKKVTVPCNELIPVGRSEVRTYDANWCIVVYKLYLIRHNEDVFGTEQFYSLEGFNQYTTLNCKCCDDFGCGLVYNDCLLLYNDCSLQYN